MAFWSFIAIGVCLSRYLITSWAVALAAIDFWYDNAGSIFAGSSMQDAWSSKISCATSVFGSRTYGYDILLGVGTHRINESLGIHFGFQQQVGEGSFCAKDIFRKALDFNDVNVLTYTENISI
jgi:hypothetical protein